MTTNAKTENPGDSSDPSITHSKTAADDDAKILGRLTRTLDRAHAAIETGHIETAQSLLKKADSLSQTFGSSVNVHPHVHVIASRGGWTKDGTWVPLPYVN